MGKINGCLKCLFIFFNVLFMIIGCILVYAAVRATAMPIQMSAVGGPSLAWLWVFAVGMLGIPCLGIYAACVEKDIPLKIFAGFMGAGMIIMLIFGIVVVVMRNKVKEGFSTLSREFVKPIMDDESSRNMLRDLQSTLQCCGVSKAEDWESEIPSSCECLSFACRTRPAGFSGPAMVYSQPCGEVIFVWIDWVFQIAMGFLFGFAAIALMGLLISILMIHQVKRHDGAGGPSIAMKGY